MMDDQLPGFELMGREALFKKMLHDAIVGNDREARKLLIKLDEKYSPEDYHQGSSAALMQELAEVKQKLAIEEARTSGGVLVVPAGVSMEVFVKEAEEQRQVMLEHQVASARNSTLNR